MSISSPLNVVAGTALRGVDRHDYDRSNRFEVKFELIDTELRLGRPAKFALEVKVPPPKPFEKPRGTELAPEDDTLPRTRPAKTIEIRFRLRSPDRAFLIAGGPRNLVVTEGETARIELEAQPVKREGQLRLTLEHAVDLDLFGDFDLSLKTT